MLLPLLSKPAAQESEIHTNSQFSHYKIETGHTIIFSQPLKMPIPPMNSCIMTMRERRLPQGREVFIPAPLMAAKSSCCVKAFKAKAQENY